MSSTNCIKFILGKKGRMTQVFDESGKAIPATVIYAGSATAVQIKTKEKDGYDAVQFGSGARKEKNIARAQLGAMKGLGTFAVLRELTGARDIQRGDTLDLSQFSPGDKVNVSAPSKGKGFQGVVKRHNFAGGPRTHGQKHTERAPGSIGATGPQRVFKGTRMAGRMGGKRITVKNLTVLHVDVDKSELIVSGAVPGRPGTLVEIKNA